MPAKMISTWSITSIGGILPLLEQFDHAIAAIEPGLRGRDRGRCRAGRRPPARGRRPESSRKPPATFFIALIWAAPPTRETEMPTFMAGRWPAKNKSGCK